MLKLTMLADEVQTCEAIGVRPEPTLAAVVAGAVSIASGQVPKRNCDVVSVQPLPVVLVVLVSLNTHPVLAAAVIPANEQRSPHKMLQSITHSMNNRNYRIYNKYLTNGLAI